MAATDDPTTAHWITRREAGGFSVERAPLGSCDPNARRDAIAATVALEPD
jgi:hypothetical protein